MGRAALRPHDPELSPRGMSQAQQLAGHLAGSGIRHLFSSPFLRARQTAQPLAEIIGVPVQVELGCDYCAVAEVHIDRESRRLVRNGDTSYLTVA